MHLHLIVALLLFCTKIEAAYEDARCKCVGFNRPSGVNGTVPSRKIYVKAVSADKCTCKNILGDENALFPNCECNYQVRNTTTIKVVVCLILVIISALTLYMIFLLLLEPLLSARRANRGPALSSSGSVDAQTAAEQQSAAAGLARFGRARLPELNIKRSWTQLTSPVTGIPKGAGMAVVWGRTRMSAEQLLQSERSPSGVSTADSKLRQRVTKPDTLFPDLSGSSCADPASGSSAPGAPPAVNVANVVNRMKDQQQRWKGNVEAQRARVFSERSLLN